MNQKLLKKIILFSLGLVIVLYMTSVKKDVDTSQKSDPSSDFTTKQSNQDDHTHSSENFENLKDSHHHHQNSKNQKKIKGSNQKKPVFKRAQIPYTAKTNTEKSVLTIFELADPMVRSEVELESLLSELKEKGLVPIYTEDKNEMMGDMIVLRTKNALPGTRYFHAQMMRKENGKLHTQYFGFDLRKEEYTFDQAIKMTESYMQSRGEKIKRTVASQNYQKWSLANDKICWISKLDYERDLANDPFNAYERKDEGDYRFVCEDEIH